MRALQVIFLIVFSLSLLLMPVFIFYLMSTENNSFLILVGIIFAGNLFFIVRKLLQLKKNAQNNEY